MMHFKNRSTGIQILFASCLLTACNTLPTPGGEHSDGLGTIDGMVIRASLVGGETRTVLSEDGGAYKVLWQTGDKVSVNGTLSEAVAAASMAFPPKTGDGSSISRAADFEAIALRDKP